MAKLVKLKLTELLVNSENFRFDPVPGQREAIDKMIEDQNDKLYNLAKHIVENGLNPNDKIQVIKSSHDHTKYLVLEGNRRTVALKILSNPELIEGVKFSSLKRKFKKLHDENSESLIRNVECTVYDDPTEAYKWIKLKHIGQNDGVGTVAWTGYQTQRYEETVEGKSSIALQAIKFLRDSTSVSESIKENLSNIPITNLDRLISDKEVKKFLGIEVYNGIMQSEIDPEEVAKGLSHIVSDLLKPKFGVKDIYTAEDRKDYINSIPKSKVPNLSKKSTMPWQLGAAKKPADPKPKPPKPNPTDRNLLIPKSCIMTIENPRINKIYREELQKIKLDKYPNAAAVLFRVFIELSIDYYIEFHKLAPLSAAKSAPNLEAKIHQVCNHMESKKWADSAICKGVKTAAKDKNDILGIDTWHAFVHNHRLTPTPKNLVIIWDSMQEFMIRLWNTIK